MLGRLLFFELETGESQGARESQIFGEREREIRAQGAVAQPVECRGVDLGQQRRKRQVADDELSVEGKRCGGELPVDCDGAFFGRDREAEERSAFEVARERVEYSVNGEGHGLLRPAQIDDRLREAQLLHAPGPGGRSRIGVRIRRGPGLRHSLGALVSRLGRRIDRRSVRRSGCRSDELVRRRREHGQRRSGSGIDEDVRACRRDRLDLGVVFDQVDAIEDDLEVLPRERRLLEPGHIDADLGERGLPPDLVNTARLVAMLDRSAEAARQIAPSEHREIGAQLPDRQIFEHERRAHVESRRVLLDPRGEGDRTLLELRLDRDPPRLVVRRIAPDRELPGGEILDGELEGRRIACEGVVVQRDVAIAEGDGVGGDGPGEGRFFFFFFGGGGLRRRRGWNRPRQQQPVVEAVEANVEALELELFDLDGAREQGEPADLGPESLRRKEGRCVGGALVAVDGEVVQRHTAAQERQVEVGELDTAGERRIGLCNEQRAQREWEGDADDHQRDAHCEQDPIASRSEQSREPAAFGSVHDGGA